MAIVINGSGTVTGLAVGGLPDGTVDAGTLATNSVDSAELIDGAVDDSHMAAMAASKLTGALPAISGASLTGFTSAQMPAGSVIQFAGVAGSAGSSEYVGDGSDYTSGINTASITIQGGTSSKIVIVSYQGASHCQDGTQGKSWVQRAISGGATTQIQDSVNALHHFRVSGAGSHYYPVSQTYIDTPNVAAGTTITYSGRYMRQSGSNSFYYLHGGYGYAFTLMEVAQ